MGGIKAPSFDGTQPCVDIGTEAFFPEDDARVTRAEAVEIKKVCFSCKFVVPCQDYAINNDVSGVWGGLTSKERQEYRKNNGIPEPTPMHKLLELFLK